jgi:hypothetical protein
MFAMPGCGELAFCFVLHGQALCAGELRRKELAGSFGWAAGYQGCTYDP